MQCNASSIEISSWEEHTKREVKLRWVNKIKEMYVQIGDGQDRAKGKSRTAMLDLRKNTEYKQTLQ